MTPEPPSTTGGGSLPPRHRPTLEELAKGTTEVDLWAFEDELEGSGGTEAPDAETRGAAKEIPGPRPGAAGRGRESGDVIPMPSAERVRINVNKPPLKSRPETSPAGPSAPESEFNDLDNWEDVTLEPEIGELPAEVTQDVTEETEMVHAVVEPIPAEDFSEASPGQSVPKQDGGASRQPAAAADRNPSLAWLRFSRLEWIGLGVLAALLFGAGAVFFFGSIRGLPSETNKAQSNDFPIEGRHFVVKSSINYWREPVSDGPGADTVRRGTKLLPELQAVVSGGPAAIRVLFRDGDREVVGDVITREVQGQEIMKFPATAGFDDIGMHAAYRTGGSKPWTIEVYEAASVNSPGRDFRKLFEMTITTDRR